jgi:transcriptional regulator with PAS, ATPase and Fis domain
MNAVVEPGLANAEFYRRLVCLGEYDAIDGLLGDALDVLVRRTGAREALIELIEEDGGNEVSHHVAHGCEEQRVAQIRGLVSRGIIGAAMATGKTMITANAAEDPRFLSFESVQRHGLEAVLCTPIGRDVPVGVVYLQGGFERLGLATDDVHLQNDVEMLSRALSAPAERLLGRSRTSVAPAEDPTDKGPFAAVVGRSKAIRGIVERLRLAAPLDVHVLLTGPTGAGKTLLASAIHLASKRCARRFVEINCATLPDNLLENELYGANPGAHSAVPKGGLKGKVEAAEGGTLFLDEIAELSLGAQAKLLQLLQNKTYYRLGGTEPRHADVRIVAATNENLKLAVQEKRFREDLYFRLLVLEVRVPSLGERPEDLLPLAARFLQDAVKRHDLSKKTLAPSAIRAIQVTEWPGNVRELANRIESAAIQAHLRGSDWIENRDVFAGSDEASEEHSPTLQAATRRFQRQHVQSILQSTDWNVTEAGQILDVSRSHVYNLINAFDLKRA